MIDSLRKFYQSIAEPYPNMKTTIVSLLGLSACVSHAVILVTPTSLSNDSGVSEFFALGNIIDNSGLSGPADFSNYATVTHAAASGTTAWTTNNPNGAGDYFLAGNEGTAAIVSFNLGGSFEVSDFVFWGYHFGAANGNEAREFSFEFSNDGGGSFGAPVVVSNDLGTYAIGDAVTLPLGGNFTADTVRMTMADNHFGGAAAGGDRLGLGEVKFVAIPEPSTSLLAGLAGLALLRRRR